MQKRLSGSVKIYSVNKEKVIEELKKLSKKFIAENKNIKEIYLFGSFVKGDYLPSSDIDILIILKEDKRRFFDRIPEFLLKFKELNFPVDVFPFTEEEIKTNKFARKAMENGIKLTDEGKRVARGDRRETKL